MPTAKLTQNSLLLAVSAINSLYSVLDIDTSATLLSINRPVSITGDLTVSGVLNGTSSTAVALKTARIISTSGDATGSAPAFDGSAPVAIPLTLATVNAAPVTTSFSKLTTNAKGLVTATTVVTTADITPLLTGLYVSKSGDTVAGSLTATSFIGPLTGNASTASTSAKLTTARSISTTGDAAWSTSFDGSVDVTSGLTLATVNTSPVSAAFVKVTTNAKGLTTATTPVVAADITSLVNSTYVLKTGDSMTGPLTVTSPGTTNGLIALSGVANNGTAIGIGRTGSDAQLAVAGTGGMWLPNTAAGDLAIRTNSATGQIVFGRGGSTTPVSTMTLDGTGNVGIGTPTPSTYGKLTVVGGVVSLSSDFSTIGSISSSTGVMNVGVYNGSGSNLTFTTSASNGNNVERMRIDSSGNVLIGTTTATNNLRVSQKLAVVSVGGVAGASLTSYNTGSTSTTLDLQHANSSVDGTLTAIAASGFGLGAVVFRGSNGSAFGDGALVSALSDGAWTTTSQPAYMVFNTTSAGSVTATEKMRIDSSGNVGIGTTASANYRLDVFGTIRGIGGEATSGYGLRLLNSTSQSGFSASVLSGTSAGAILSSDAGPMMFITGGSTERLRIDTSGNLGLNINPSTNFGHGGSSKSIQILNSDTAANSQAHLFLGSSASIAGSAIGSLSWVLPSISTTAFQGYIGLTTGADHTSANPTSLMSFGTRQSGQLATERMRLSQNGNLLIGTTVDSGYKLQVNGTSNFSNNLSVGQGSGAGYVKLDIAMSAGRTGYTSFFASNDVRQGYIGWASPTSATQDQGTVNYVAGSHNFIGGLTSNQASVFAGAAIGFNAVSNNVQGPLWWPLAYLPPSTAGTYDTVQLTASLNDNWGSGANRAARFIFGNRNGFTAKFLALEGGGLQSGARILAYTRSDGSTVIYAYAANGYFSTIAAWVMNSNQAIVYSNPQATNVDPIGTSGTTFVFDSATAQPFTTIFADGSFGVTTKSTNSGGVGVTLPNGANGAVGMNVSTVSSTSGSSWYNFVGQSGNGSGVTTNNIVIASNGNIINTNNSYGSTSDERLKQDIVDASSQWDDLKAVRVRKFRLKADPTGPLQIGVIAQELELTSPGLVREELHPGVEEELKVVNYSVLYMKAIKALQESMARVEELESQMAQVLAKLGMTS